jgi:hypothetical protein
MPNLLALLALCSPAVTFADPEQPWRDAAAEQLRARLAIEWKSIVDAKTTVGWTVELPRDQRFAGGWALRTSDGWTYLFDGATVRCRIQPGTPSYVTCNGGDFVDDTVARIAIGRITRPRSLQTLLVFHRGVFGKGATVHADAKGRATVETTVSEAPAASRISRRYRAPVTLATTGFTVGEPVLVEQYREHCQAVQGCYELHWNCARATSAAL